MRSAIAIVVIAVLGATQFGTSSAAEAPRTPPEPRSVPMSTTPSTTVPTTTTLPIPASTVTLPAEPEPAGIEDALCPDMWRTALAVGFTEDDLETLDEIVWSESNCRADVVSHTSDYGLAQINWAAHGARLSAKGITRDMLLDPVTNLTEALWIADYATEHYGCRWQPWYMSGDRC